MRPLVGDLDAFAVLARERNSAREDVEKTLVKLHPARRAMRLQPLAGQVIGGGATVFVAGRYQPAARLVFDREFAKLVAPCATQVSRNAWVARRIGLLGRLLQRRAHFLDFADPGAHLDGEIDREIPDVVGRKISEHRPLLRSRSRQAFAWPCRNPHGRPPVDPGSSGQTVGWPNCFLKSPPLILSMYRTPRGLPCASTNSTSTCSSHWTICCICAASALAAERMNMTQSAMSNALAAPARLFRRRSPGQNRPPARIDAARRRIERAPCATCSCGSNGRSPTTSQFDPARSDRQFNILVSRLYAGHARAENSGAMPGGFASRPLQFSAIRSTGPSACWNAATSTC